MRSFSLIYLFPFQPPNRNIPFNYSLIINLGSSYSSLTLERFETYLMNISTEHFIIDKWNSEAMEAIIWVC